MSMHHRHQQRLLRLYRGQQQRHNRLLAQLCKYTQDGNMEQLYCLFHEYVSSLLPCENIYIALKASQKSALKIVYAVDGKDQLSMLSLSQEQLMAGLTGMVMQTNEPLLCGPEQFAQIESLGLATQVGKLAHSWLGAPIQIEGEAVGVVAVQSYKGQKAHKQSNIALLTSAVHLLSSELARSGRISVHNKIEATDKNQISTLLYQARHDPLTGLPNRQMLLERLEQAIAHHKRHTDHQFALLFVDLDRFKRINDSLGHMAGDQVLIEAGERLVNCIRRNDLLARLGGDEFVILLDTLNHKQAAEEIAQRTLQAISEPFNVEGCSFQIGCSIGLAYCHSGYHHPEELLRDADTAMYQAKTAGRECYITFDASMRQAHDQAFAMEQAIRQGLKHGQFIPHFQPIIDLKSNKIVGLEALLRWHHPSEGIKHPKAFLVTATDSGLIVAIDRMMLTEVCYQLAALPPEQAPMMAVNLSHRHLLHPAHVQSLLSIIDNSGVEKSKLLLEFAEADCVQMKQTAIDSLATLKQAGVHLAIDQFGSGQASLQLLQQCPVDFIKLDQQFVSQLSEGKRQQALFRALLDLSQQMGCELVAEGIEDAQQQKQLTAMGCRYGQGFWLAKPEAHLAKMFAVDNVAHSK
ncbi:EAL domain-containing protein [Corallincola platygyrae]|uniref:EAL domain-containing protein n=1 Tax=Corallincola platygyrae TaxID=1193278 RepID=A0ABW4XPY8_9GAMM